MEDHYTIVAIISKKGSSSKVEYSYVPYQWVKDGFVFWPSKGSQTLRDNPSSAPEPGWKKYKCKVKKDFIVGKEEAELWEEEYVNASCTESETTLAISRQLRTINMNDTNKKINPTNIDALFDDIVASNPNINAAASTDLVDEPIYLRFASEHENLVPVDSGDGASNLADNVAVLYQEQVTLNTIYEKLRSIEERQQTIEENHKRLLEMRNSDNASLKLTLDRMYAMIKDLHDGTTTTRPTTSYEKPKESEFANKFIFPLNNLLNVQAFNLEIEKNPDYKKYLLDHFKTVGGTEGTEEGKLVAKNLLAILFTKEVLTNFSWTGISRTSGVEKKEAFHSYCGILTFFTEILVLADSRWNATKNDTLFKMHILKHAKQINEASKKKKNLRAGRQEKSDEVPVSTDSGQVPLQNVVEVEQEQEQIMNTNES